MFQRDVEPKGGFLGMLDSPEENEEAKTVLMDDASREERARHLAPENDVPWTPLEDAKVEEFEHLFEVVDGLDMPELVDKYQHRIQEMQSILKKFRNGSLEEKKVSFVELELIKEYVDRLDGELAKRDLKYQNDFWKSADSILKKEGIDRKFLMAEVSMEILMRLREANERKTFR